MLNCIRKVLLSLAEPFLRRASGVHLPFTHKRITGVQYHEIKPHLRPGSIFVTYISGELTSAIIPGNWSHAAIYTDEELVTEAEAPGVIQTDLITFITSKDYLLLLEPICELQTEVMKLAASIATKQVGKPYDFQLDDRSQAFYCSELVWFSYQSACKQLGVECPFKPTIIMGEPMITPQQLADDQINFRVLYDSRKRA
jgi:uncharacterized protein YycO